MTTIISLPIRQPATASEKVAPNRIQEQKRFLENLPDRISGLTTAWNKLKYINWDTQFLAQLYKNTIQLQEVSQSLLLTRISDRVHELQQMLKLTVEQGYASAHQRNDIDNALSQLCDATDTARRYNKTNTPVTLDTLSKRLLSIHVALVEEDSHLAAMTRHLLEQSGYQVSVFHHPRHLASTLDTTFYNVVLLDTTYHDGALAGISWLESREGRFRDIPMIVLSARTDIVARLRAVRAGANAYVIKAGDIEHLHHKILQTLQYLHHPKDRILIVDSNSERLSEAATRLHADGFETDTLSLPLLLLERLVRLRPDAVLINYDLPGCNGIELGNLLRHDPTLMSIPIVYMADLTQTSATHEALSLLGNACVALPIDFDALGGTLRHEITRARMIAGPASVSETVADLRLLHRAEFYAELETLLTEAGKSENRSTDWYLAYVGVDGYAQLRKTLRLRSLVEREETLERYFAVRPEIDGMGCCLGDMRYLLVLRDLEGMGGEALLQRLHTLSVAHHHERLAEAGNLRLSIGVAALHTLHSLDDALEQTELACARAQREGGNQVAWSSLVPLRKTHLSTPMRQALRNRSFKLVYQPIVNLDKEDVWFEALVRLVDAQGQTYMPQQFLEWVDTDMEGGSFTLDRLIIEQSLEALTNLGGKSGAGYSLIVKLSPDLLQCERLLPYISNVVNGARLRGVKRTTLSLPESCVIRDLPRAKRLIRHIHGLNCGFMLEQVVLSAQSQALLKELGVIDFIKLHSGWRTQIEKDKHYRDTLQSLLRLMPDVKLVASHVEDAKSFATLWEVGVRYFQGYFIQEPGEELTAAPFEAAV